MNAKERICVSYGGGRIEEIDSAIVLCDWLEIRMDLCSFTDNEYQNVFSSIENTIAADLSGKSRENLLRAIDFGAKIIDIGIDNPDFDLIYSKTITNNKKIIISLHNYDSLPTKDELNKFLEICVEKKADYCKIACKLNSNDDILTLTDLYKNPLIVKGVIQLLAMGLGKFGPLSRIVALEFGAPFVYCSYLDRLATADGQLNVFDFVQIYNKLFIK